MSTTLPPADTKQLAKLQTIGHHWAVDLLTRQLVQEQIAHAYLFTGPPQVGKGTLARWFAQALLCQGQEPPPCEVCPACHKVARGIHPDLRLLNLEIQPGGRRTLGIESVRTMRSGIAERPFSSSRKVYLLEDTESLTIEASNALLKTLEEPPPSVVLLLVALSDHLLLPTIVSRCQVIPLQTLRRQEVQQALIERWGATEKQGRLLAALSHGRVGWAIQALQDPSPLKRRDEQLGELTRLMEAGLLERFAFAQTQERHWQRGQHAIVLELLERWQSWWRDLLVVGNDCADLIVNLDLQEPLRAAAQRVPPETAYHFLRALRFAQQRLLEQVNPRLVFEDLLLQMPAVVV